MKEEDDERTFTVRRFKPGNFAIYPLAPPLRPHQGGKFPLAPPPYTHPQLPPRRGRPRTGISPGIRTHILTSCYLPLYARKDPDQGRGRRGGSMTLRGWARDGDGRDGGMRLSGATR